MFLPFLGGGLLTDDFLHITRQQHAPSLTEVISTPDPFHFYRPVVQLSFWIESHAFGVAPPLARLVNLMIHLLCVIAVASVGLMLGLTPRGALLSALAFALTPKAHPTAVLWISARNELLMTLFVLLSFAAWTAWTSSRERIWLVLSVVSYGLAICSKETAFLLPLVLAVTSFMAGKKDRRDVTGIALMLAAAVCVLAIRSYAGALMPDTSDAHYGLMRPAARWLRNLENYAGRVVPAPLGLVLLVGFPAWIRTRPATLPGAGRLVVFAVCWFAVFMGPVLPIPARSELYLYLPSVGICLLAGFAVDSVLPRQPTSRMAFASLATYVLLFGGYQLTRIKALSDDLQFSARLVREIEHALTGYKGTVVILPADPSTAQLMADSIGGYGDVALKMATGHDEVNGAIGAEIPPGAEHARRLLCLSRDGRVQLTSP